MTHRSILARSLFAVLAGLVVGCTASRQGAGANDGSLPSDPAGAPGTSASELRGDRGGALPPLQGEGPLISLPVAGHRPAIVSLPRGARSPRPVIVAAHGAGGRPEFQCELWRRLVGDSAFVLCVTGAAMFPHEPRSYAGYFFTGHPALGREMTAAFAALEQRFGPHVDGDGPMFVGYSQGAIMGALLLPEHPLRFHRAVLIEGGFGHYQEWNVAVARRFASRGGRRVLLACGRARCAEQAEQTARYLRLGGLEARVIYARGAGHGYGEPMPQALRSAWDWLVADDLRFSPGRAGAASSWGGASPDEPGSPER